MILEASDLTLQEGAKPTMAEVLEPGGQNREASKWPNGSSMQ